MKTTKTSSKKSRRTTKKTESSRINGQLIPFDKPAWSSWKRSSSLNQELHEVEYEGEKFLGANDGYSIVVGRSLKYNKPSSVVGLHQADSWDIYPCLVGIEGSWPPVMGADQSCAYSKFSPTMKAGSEKMFEWYLRNLEFDKGTTCYLTKNDGPVKAMLAILRARGFRLCAINKSKHEGRYNVYLLVHPGDNVKAPLKKALEQDVELSEEQLASL